MRLTELKQLAIAGGLAALTALLALATAGAAGEFAFVTTTDYITGSCSTIDLDGSWGVTQNVASIHSDAVSRYYGGRIYVINRGGADNIQILDPDAGFSTVRQFTTGNGSNPQDVAFASPTKMYVTRYESNTMWIMNPQTGAQTGSVDLSAFADADGLCEMRCLFLYSGRLFVTIQRMDRDNFWAPSGTSYVAVIDVATDTLIDTDPGTPGVQAITLANTNPFSEIQLDPWTGYLYVACAGYWGLNDGGVELIDPDALVSAGTMFAETAAAGDVLDAEIVNKDVGYCLIQNASFHTDLISFNPSTGTKIQTVYSPGDWVLQDIERAHTGELFLADRTAVNPGLRVYDSATGDELTTNPIDVGLPPFDITFSVEVQTGVKGAPPVASLGNNYPNPFNPSTTIPIALERDARVVLEIFDVRGARVATLVDEVLLAGGHEAMWNGRDAASRPSPSGVYFARLTAAGNVMQQKLLLLK
jgi:DNA-binding beta-propeller fold protein YncE